MAGGRAGPGAGPHAEHLVPVLTGPAPAGCPSPESAPAPRPQARGAARGRGDWAVRRGPRGAAGDLCEPRVGAGTGEGRGRAPGRGGIRPPPRPPTRARAPGAPEPRPPGPRPPPPPAPLRLAPSSVAAPQVPPPTSAATGCARRWGRGTGAGWAGRASPEPGSLGRALSERPGVPPRDRASGRPTWPRPATASQLQRSPWAGSPARSPEPGAQRPDPACRQGRPQRPEPTPSVPS